MPQNEVLGLEPESRPKTRSCRRNEQSQERNHHGQSLHDRALKREPARIYFSEGTGISGRSASTLAQLWPVKDAFIAWPTNDIRDHEADAIAGFIFHKLHAIGRMAGY